MFLKKGFSVLLLAMFCMTAAHAAEVSIPSGQTCNLSTTTLDIGNITNAGTLQLTTGTINVGGNWTNSGTFNGGTGLVKFTGTNQTISGASTFYNFTCATAGDQLNFEAGKTQTISSTWTLTGSSGKSHQITEHNRRNSMEGRPQGHTKHFLRGCKGLE